MEKKLSSENACEHEDNNKSICEKVSPNSESRIEERDSENLNKKSPPVNSQFNSLEQEKTNSRVKNRKLKTKYTTLQEAESASHNLILAIQDAIEKDNIAAKENKIALSKQKLLNEIETKISNREFCETFLDQGGLEVLGSMIEKMENGCYPNSNFREQVITILRNLPVNNDHLSRTKVGSLLVELERSGQELKPTLQRISEIKQKWSRIICNINSSYSNLAHKEFNRNTSLLVQREKLSTLRKPFWREKEEEIDATKMRRTRVYHDFAEQPKFVIEGFSSVPPQVF